MEGFQLKSNQGWILAIIVVFLVGSTVAAIKLRPKLGLDIQGGMRVVLRAQKEQLRTGKWSPQNLETVKGIIQNRVDALGVSEPVIYSKPDQDQIVVELPGVRDKEQALESIKTTARLEFRYVPELERDWRTEEGTEGKNAGYEVITGPNGPISPEELDAKVFSKDPVLAGDELLPNAKADLGQDGQVVIHFEFKGESKRVFEQFTRGHLQKRLAIFLDKKLISAPVIEDVIPGSGIIRGHFTPESAQVLASQLNAGALPVPLELQQQQTLEATLGRKAVHDTMIAGAVGLGLVLIFMVAYYGLPGLLANLALLMYSLFSYAVFVGGLSWIGFSGVTLTLPGIAGFILSIGMAVDANVLIFERLKEERNLGKSIRSAIEAGFKRAFTAIFDSNFCTLITCAILYHFGTGSVRGFAVTLAIGVVISMFTAITCSRTFLLLLASTGLGQNDSLYRLRLGVHPKLGVTKRIPVWFGISGALIVPGIIFTAMGGLKPSIEFTGGSEMQLQYSTPPTVSQIQSVLSRLGHKENKVVLAEGNRAYVTTKQLKEDEKRELTAALAETGGKVDSFEMVSGAVSKELTRNAVMSVLIAGVLIVLYLGLRFAIGGVLEGLKFGVCAIAATFHDVLVLIGIFAILGFVLGWQVDSLFITALLTVIGFSTHDTIVIFDRIRENLRHKARSETFADVVDRSIEQTLARSINTSLTVVLTLTALLVLGGPVVRVFVAALLMGVISGTYSSIFNASPLLVLWRKMNAQTEGAAAAAGGARTGSVRPAPAPAPTPKASSPAAEGDASGETAARTKTKKKTQRRM